MIMMVKTKRIITNYPLLKAALQMPLSRSVAKFGRQMPPRGGNAVLTACVMLGLDLPESEESQSHLPHLNKLTTSFSAIYPNPANETATMKYMSPEGCANMEILDIYGRSIAKYYITSYNDIFTFRVGNLCAGVYFINIEQKGVKLYSSKFVVIK